MSTPNTIPMSRIVLYQGRDQNLTLTVLNADGTDRDLTGATVHFCRKSSRLVPDTDSSFRQYNCPVSSPATAGIVTVTIPASDNNTPGVGWWRLDVTEGGVTELASCGPLEVFAV